MSKNIRKYLEIIPGSNKKNIIKKLKNLKGKRKKYEGIVKENILSQSIRQLKALKKRKKDAGIVKENV